MEKPLSKKNTTCYPVRMWEHTSSTIHGLNAMNCTRVSDIVKTIPVAYAKLLLRKGSPCKGM